MFLGAFLAVLFVELCFKLFEAVYRFPAVQNELTFLVSVFLIWAVSVLGLIYIEEHVLDKDRESENTFVYIIAGVGGPLMLALVSFIVRDSLIEKLKRN